MAGSVLINNIHFFRSILLLEFLFVWPIAHYLKMISSEVNGPFQAANDVFRAYIVGHGGCDIDGVLVGVIHGHNKRVGNLAGIVLDPNAAHADGSPWKLRPQGDVKRSQFVIEQIRCDPTRIIPEFTESEESVRIPGPARSFSEPGLPVDIRISRSVWGRIRIDGPVPLTSCPAVTSIRCLAPHRFSNHAGKDHSLRLPPPIARRSLCPDLENTPCLLTGFPHLFGFFRRSSHRLLKIHVFAGFHGIDCIVDVPMVRCGNVYRVDIGSVQKLLAVSVAIPAADVFCPAQTSLVDVADRDQLAVTLILAACGQLADVAGPHASRSDDPEIDPVVGSQNARGRRPGHGSERDAGRRGLYEFSPVDIVGSCGCHWPQLLSPYSYFHGTADSSSRCVFMLLSPHRGR